MFSHEGWALGIGHCGQPFVVGGRNQREIKMQNSG